MTDNQTQSKPDAPDSVYFQIDDDTAEWPKHDRDVTFSRDQIRVTDVKYVRADLLESLQAENAALKPQLAELKELFPPAFLKDAREWLESEDAPDDYKESARLIIAALGDAPQATEPK